jgi:glycosyltransferase involved in cell wall biosynthesis
MIINEVRALYPVYATTGGANYACQQLLAAMAKAGLPASLYCVAADRAVEGSLHRVTLPSWARRFGYRVFSNDFLIAVTERRFIAALNGKEVAYIWPATSLSTFQTVKNKGCVVVAENINTHQATSREILDAEYRRLGMTPSHGISSEDAAMESAKLKYVDYVFSPSPCVTNSLLDAGIPQEKIISSSYGLEDDDILLEPFANRDSNQKGITAIFVGRIGVRKGAHLLLDYWVKSGVKGTLKLVGNIESNARHLIEPFLSRPDVEHIGYSRDLRSIYRDADVFLLPSLEEGSPLVTYLCLGAGLPSVVSPMGGGGVVRDGTDGVVLDPHDEEGWVTALRRIAKDADTRLVFGRNAYAHSADYTWEKVGARRWQALRESIGSQRGVQA